MLGNWHNGLPNPPFKEGPAAPLVGAIAGSAASSYIASGAILTGGFASASLAASMGMGLTVAGAIGGALVSTAVSGLLAGDVDRPDFGQGATAASGMLVNKAANDAPIPVVYGRRTVGGTRVLMEVTGDNNEYLHIVLVLSEGEIESIENIYLNNKSVVPNSDPQVNDEDLTDIFLSSFADATLDGKFFGLNIRDAIGTIAWGVDSSADIAEFTYFDVKTGADDQLASSDLVSEVGIWTNNHRLRGTAYLYAKLKYDRDAFPSGLPTITADVKGVKVYDPRTSTTAWSDNPALCIRDYLTNTRYGRGIDASLIDDTAFNAAANYCEEQVTIGGETKDRYTLNGVVDTSQGSMDVLKKLLTACRGFLVFSGGKYKLIIDKPETAAFTFSEDNIVGAWSISLGNKNNQFNRIRANFFNPDRSWQPDIAVVDSPTLRTDDNGLLLEKTIDLPFTSDIDRAKMITTINLNQSRQQITCEFTATIEGLRCEVGDVVYIKHTTPGWETLNSNQGKLFRIMRLAIQNNDEVRVLALEYDVNAYDFGTISASDTAPNTNLPDPRAVGQISNLAFTMGAYYGTGVGTLSWTAPNDAFVSEYKIRILETDTDAGEHSWLFGFLSSVVISTDDTSYALPWLQPGNYRVGVACVNTMGVTSTYSILDFTVEVPPLTVRVSGLELDLGGEFGEANSNEWTGRDAKIKWRPASVYMSPEIDEAAEGGDTGSLDWYHKDYKVEVYNGSTLLREEYVTDSWYIYTFEKNAEDAAKNSTTAYRNITFKVWARGKQNQLSQHPAILTGSNPAPVLASINIDPRVDGGLCYYTAPSDLDYVGLRLYASEDSGFTVDRSTLLVDTKDTQFLLSGLKGGTTYYYKIVPYDDFGDGATSAESSFETYPFTQRGSITVNSSVDMEDRGLWGAFVVPYAGDGSYILSAKMDLTIYQYESPPTAPYGATVTCSMKAATFGYETRLQNAWVGYASVDSESSATYYGATDTWAGQTVPAAGYYLEFSVSGGAPVTAYVSEGDFITVEGNDGTGTNAVYAVALVITGKALISLNNSWFMGNTGTSYSGVNATVYQNPDVTAVASTEAALQSISYAATQDGSVSRIDDAPKTAFVEYALLTDPSTTPYRWIGFGTDTVIINSSTKVRNQVLQYTLTYGATS